ncbi:hypothetical protein ACEWPM_017595 [Roseovarius sp. S4756]|uniref:hypothetical protein n=1 Tax=Roseovarius maritimus TaxID=3342637 RepID=UPI00372AA005
MDGCATGCRRSRQGTRCRPTRPADDFKIGDILCDFEKRLDLVSAYFVPGKAGTEYFASLAETGKDVRILTNALNATDVVMVHVGYSKYRRELLEAGVDLYELKLRGNMTPETEMQIKPLGLSGARLHAKTLQSMTAAFS